MSQENAPLLEVNHLSVVLKRKGVSFKAVDGLSFRVEKGRTLGIVGESGCGKSMTASAVMGLIPPQIGGVSADSSILYQGNEILHLPPKAMRDIRGSELGLILQDSMTSLNPVTTIQRQMTETVLAHRKVSRKEAIDLSIEMLRNVGIPSPELRIKEYPHQMSGGLKQRICIAIALLCKPKLIIADEPTTALDVTIQAQILDLIKRLREAIGMAAIVITHDLGVVTDIADDVLVMYAGQEVEYAKADSIFEKPLHPYTQGLLASIPQIHGEVKKLPVIPGHVPAAGDSSVGCRFHSRCSYADTKCRESEPPLRNVGDSHVRCWLTH
jgi:oligopeptide/dipeptide ABC transporter ATP-binding protein